jgi:flagellar hook-length control protein FliK
MNDFLNLPAEAGRQQETVGRAPWAAPGRSRATSRAYHCPAECSRVDQPGREEPFSKSLEKARKRQPDEPAEALSAEAAGLQVPELPAGLQPAAIGQPASGDQSGAEASESASGSQPVVMETLQSAGGQALPTVAAGSRPQPGTEPAVNAAAAASVGEAGEQRRENLTCEAVKAASQAAPLAGFALPEPVESAVETTPNPQAAVRTTPAVQAPAFEVVMAAADENANGLQSSPAQVGSAQSSQPAGVERPQAEQPSLAVGEPTEKGVLEQRSPNARPGMALEEPGTSSGQSGAQSSPGETQAVLTAYGGSSPVQEVKAILVEPARLAEAREARFVDQLADGIQILERTGDAALRLQLHPENLGKIDLRVTSGAEGLRVTLTALQADTRHLLNSHLPDLRQALEQAGINLAGLSIGYGSHPNGAQPEHWRAQPGQGAGKGKVAGTGGGISLEGMRLHRRVSAGEVDYRV